MARNAANVWATLSPYEIEARSNTIARKAGSSLVCPQICAGSLDSFLFHSQLALRRSSGFELKSCKRTRPIG
jgi:hypothetical protein